MKLKSNIAGSIGQRLGARRAQSVATATLLFVLAVTGLLVGRTRAAAPAPATGDVASLIKDTSAGKPEADPHVLRQSRSEWSTAGGSLSWLSNPRDYTDGSNVFSKIFASRTGMPLSAPDPMPFVANTTNNYTGSSSGSLLT